VAIRSPAVRGAAVERAVDQAAVEWEAMVVSDRAEALVAEAASEPVAVALVVDSDRVEALVVAVVSEQAAEWEAPGWGAAPVQTAMRRAASRAEVLEMALVVPAPASGAEARLAELAATAWEALAAEAVLPPAVVTDTPARRLGLPALAAVAEPVALLAVFQEPLVVLCQLPPQLPEPEVTLVICLGEDRAAALEMGAEGAVEELAEGRGPAAALTVRHRVALRQAEALRAMGRRVRLHPLEEQRLIKAADQPEAVELGADGVLAHRRE